MKNFTLREIWLPLDVNGDEEASTLNGAAPLIFPGFEYMFRIGIFDRMPAGEDDPGEFRNIASLVAFIMRVKQTSYAGTTLIDTSDGAAIAAGATVLFDPTCTEAEFVAKTKAPVNVYLPAAITNPTGITSAEQQWVTFTGATVDAAAQPDAFGRCRLRVIDLGQGAASSPPAPATNYVTSDIFAAAMNGVVKFGVNPRGRYPILVNTDGSKGTTVRAGDNGELVSEIVENP
jgi:hypothetical protein